MRLKSLDERLTLCASFVRQGKKVADIGTDHAYLPVYLVYTGKAVSAVATDINEGPLNSAKLNVEKYGLSDKIDLRLCDGLDKVTREDADDIIIAGMGGELIRDILKRCDFIKDSDVNLILQPMTKYEELIRYLYDNGFYISKQKACKAGSKIYTVILASYSGEIRSYSDEDIYTGALDLCDKLSVEFLKQTVSHLKKKGIKDKDLQSTAQRLEKKINEHDKTDT